ncbi:MAG: SoxR reducing system RseC family protein [Bacteroidetes bacterium]|nr:SoxR reducing system RseC family protein [Bacteroidota bacterium]
MGNKTKNDIRHTGVVTSVKGSLAVVKIATQSACASCHAKSACSASDMQDKNIEAQIPKGMDIKIGDTVDVVISRSVGYIAVLFAYLLPVIILLASVIIVTKMGYTEDIGGLVGLANMVLYFIVLYLFRKKLNKKISIVIEK